MYSTPPESLTPEERHKALLEKQNRFGDAARFGQKTSDGTSVTIKNSGTLRLKGGKDSETYYAERLAAEGLSPLPGKSAQESYLAMQREDRAARGKQRFADRQEADAKRRQGAKDATERNRGNELLNQRQPRPLATNDDLTGLAEELNRNQNLTPEQRDNILKATAIKQKEMATLKLELDAVRAKAGLPPADTPATTPATPMSPRKPMTMREKLQAEADAIARSRKDEEAKKPKPGTLSIIGRAPLLGGTGTAVDWLFGW